MKSNTPAVNYSTRINGLLGLTGLFISYLFVSWSIDSGSIFVYIGTFLSLIYSVFFIRKALTQFFAHDKTITTRRAKSSN